MFPFILLGTFPCGCSIHLGYEVACGARPRGALASPRFMSRFFSSALFMHLSRQFPWQCPLFPNRQLGPLDGPLDGCYLRRSRVLLPLKLRRNSDGRGCEATAAAEAAAPKRVDRREPPLS